MMEKYILDGQYKQYLEMVGIDVGEALRSAGVPEDLFSRERPMMEEAEYYHFMEAVGSQIADPSLPVRIASADHIENFSPPIFAAFCSRNGWECLKRLGQYKRLIAPMRYEANEVGDTVELTIMPSREGMVLPQFLVETEIVFSINIIRKATKYDVTPLRIEMMEPVTDEPFSNYVRCDIGRGAENKLIYRREDTERPFVSHNETMWAFFEPELRRRLSEMEKDDTMAAKVRSALTELLPGGAGTIEDVADKLGVSRRSLQRKLSEEGTTFQKQLNGTRELLARHYLRNTDISSDDIAFLLGYQESNSFLRAFSLWTGMSVSAYRRSRMT